MGMKIIEDLCDYNIKRRCIVISMHRPMHAKRGPWNGEALSLKPHSLTDAPRKRLVVLTSQLLRQ